MLLSLLTLLSASSSAHAVIYTGTLTAPASSGVTATGGAWLENVKISWQVEDTFGDWLYTYTITDLAGGKLGAEDGTAGGISHAIFEISTGATEDDFYGFKFDGTSTTNYEFGDFGDEGGSNPGIPGNIYGIKIEEEGKTFSFFSVKDPVWGNFYTKDGNAGGGANAAWNTDYLVNVDNEDSANFVSTLCPAGGECYLPDGSGGIVFKILRPDTTGGGGGGVPPPGSEIPEPSTMFLLGSGAVGFLINKKRKK